MSQVGSTVAAGVGEHPEFARRFYDRLFAAAPQTIEMFAEATAPEQRLADELEMLVSLLDDIESLDARARDLGGRHRGYGMRAGHYRIARAVMTETLHEVLGDDFGPGEEEAWNRATSLIAEVMQATDRPASGP